MARETSPVADSRSSFTGGSALDALLRGARPLTLHDREAPLPNTLRNGKIKLGQRIGRGSMGTVYEAVQDDGKIALKSLNRCNGEQIYRFKQEFRMLADISHPHVIKVRELFCENDRWFFTMELVDGVSIDRYVHGLTCTYETRTGLELHEPRRSNAYFDHIRRLVQQLIDGVATVHGIGLIHRDLKPSNVLVENSGRVVILDFGLVSALCTGGVGQTIDGTIAGTPGYLAPELALRGAVTPAGDWYAVGVMLYELLTQQLPIRGAPHEWLNKKAAAEPPAPITLYSDIPNDLNALCCSLLRRDPKQRPTAAQLLVVSRNWQAPLHAPTFERTDTHDLAAQRATRFVGRSHLLEELTASFHASAREAHLVLVEAASGIGKSALLEHFAEHLQHSPTPLVLKGRCHERERVPYKGLDSIIDACTRLLLRSPREQVAQLLPPQLACLARFFPALLRVEQFRKAADEEREPTSPHDQQRGAVAALRELFSRLAARQPLVLLIDDLHWADTDGLSLLAEVLAPPHAPRMLVVATHHAAHDVDGRKPREMRQMRPPSALSLLTSMRGLAQRSLRLGALSPAEAKELTLQLVPNDAPTAQCIATESAGVPYFLHELVQHYRRHACIEGDLRLDALLARRIEELSNLQRTALELAAVMSRPIAPALLERALATADASRAIDDLRRQKLFTSGDAYEGLVLYHEDIARVALSTISGERITAHQHTLIAALNASDSPDGELLAALYEAVGDAEHAAQLTLRTARRAARALAFERAADLYAKTVDLYGARAPLKLYLGAAHANANCGRGPEAAKFYLRLAQQVEPAQAARLAARAAMQWARAAGTARDRRAVLKGVLYKAGVQTVLNTQLAQGMRKHVPQLRDTHNAVRRVSVSAARTFARLDALYPGYGAGFGALDSLRGAYLAALTLPVAQATDDRSKPLNTLTAEAMYCSMLHGSHAGPRVARLRSEIRSVAARGGDDVSALGLVDFTSSMAAYWEGRWSQVIQPALLSEQRLRSDPSNHWEANLVRSARHTVQMHVGQFGELARELQQALPEAHARHDLNAKLALTRAQACSKLASDDYDGLHTALQALEDIDKECSEHAGGIGSQSAALDYLRASLEVSAALHQNDLASARARVERHWRACRKNGLHRSALLRVFTHGMRLDCAFMDADSGPDTRAAELRLIAKACEREPIAFAAALGASARASASAITGDRSAALRELTWASDQFRAHTMHVPAAAVLLRMGGLLGGAEGDELVVKASALLQEMGIVNPLRWSRSLHSLY